MRKAFDANVPKLKPRLRAAAPAPEAAALPLGETAAETTAAAPAPAVPTENAATPAFAAPAPTARRRDVSPLPPAEPGGEAEGEGIRARRGAAAPQPALVSDVLTRKD